MTKTRTSAVSPAPTVPCAVNVTGPATLAPPVTPLSVTLAVAPTAGPTDPSNAAAVAMTLTTDSRRITCMTHPLPPYRRDAGQDSHPATDGEPAVHRARPRGGQGA